MPTKRPIIIDCDTGLDDAIALIAAFGSSEEIDLRAITSCNGNVAEQYVAQNNLDLTEYLGQMDVPVTRGAYLPLAANRMSNADAIIHGKTGLGDIALPKATVKQYDSRMASRVIYEEALACKGELELIVTGPMTNAALAIMQYPELKTLIKHIYFMGGAISGGNTTTSAEFNIWADPEAAHFVMTCGIPQTMVGLDVTTLVTMTAEDEQELRAYGSKASVLSADLLDYMLTKRSRDLKHARMHDALTLAACIYAECLEFKDYYGDTEVTGTYSRGHTHIDTYNKDHKENNVRVAVKVDVPAFRTWLKQRIKNV